MPTIIQINATLNWGSTGRIAEECNIIAWKQGWNCFFAFSRMSNNSSSKPIKICSKLSVIFAGIEARLFDNAGLSQRLATLFLIKKIKRINPDIIHLHNIHGFVLNYKMLFEFLNKTNINIVWTFHDFWAITGHCAHFIYKGCDKWKVLCQSCPLIYEYPHSLTDHSSRNFLIKKKLFSENKNLHIVAVSKWVEDTIRLSFLGNKDICTIPNGIDTNIFSPTPGFHHPQVESNKFVILSVASQWKDKNKGLQDYFRLSEMLSDDEIIVIVGIPSNFTKKLPPKIIGLERTNSPKNLAAIYTRADVVTSFSYAETFGLTIIEGYACGTPAVVYNNTALPLLITENTGYSVPTGNYCAAYDAIQKIKLKGKTAYSKECISLAKRKYSKSQCLNSYASLYKRILNQNN